MARSKFERDLSPGLRKIGFSIKIPDVGVGRKPFDYVVGIPVKNTRLKFVAIEAKKARGWSLGPYLWRSHQRRALSIVESLCPYSSWVAIGFLDAPKMKLDYNRTRLDKPADKTAYIIPWRLTLELEIDGSLSYGDILPYENMKLEWACINNRYHWIVPVIHPILRG